jgi:hypothetical protein
LFEKRPGFSPFVTTRVAIETCKFSIIVSFIILNYCLNVIPRVVVNFQPYRLLPKQSQTPTPPYRINNKKAIISQSASNLLHIIFRANSFHKEHKTWVLFLHQVVEDSNCLRVPKPSAVPT